MSSVMADNLRRPPGDDSDRNDICEKVPTMDRSVFRLLLNPGPGAMTKQAHEMSTEQAARAELVVVA